MAFRVSIIFSSACNRKDTVSHWDNALNTDTQCTCSIRGDTLMDLLISKPFWFLEWVPIIGSCYNGTACYQIVNTCVVCVIDMHISGFWSDTINWIVFILIKAAVWQPKHWCSLLKSLRTLGWNWEYLSPSSIAIALPPFQRLIESLAGKWNYSSTPMVSQQHPVSWPHPPLLQMITVNQMMAGQEDAAEYCFQSVVCGHHVLIRS